MKSFESCLFPILQVFYEKIKNKDYSLPKNTNEVDSSVLPLHLVNFMKSLNENSSTDNTLLAVKTALQNANSCNLCYSCKKCAHQFYLAIAELMIPNYLDNDISNKKQDIERRFGKLSFRKPPFYLNYHFNGHNNLWQNYLQNIEQKQYERKINNKLIILKGMSSSSPYIYNEIYNNHSYTGGGFYLKYKGYGIAIDPGYGFIENMYRNKITIQDIDAVIITHNHIDHTNDMRLINDLNHQFQSENHKIYWYMDEATNKNCYCGFNEETNICRIVKDPHLNNEEIDINEDISFIPFKTEHILKDEHKGEYDTCTFGFVLNLKGNSSKHIKIGYTSDTRYFDNFEKFLDGSNIIIANISGIYYDDYLLVKQKPRHLGYRGCYYILQNLTKAPDIFIVSEFWCGETDLRLDVCKALDLEKRGNVKIMPGDVGLHIDLDNIQVKCSRCGKYQHTSNIFSVKPNTDFDSIDYICKDCLL